MPRNGAKFPSSAPIESVKASAFTIPAEMPEADGTLAWSSTTLVLAEVAAGGRMGTGYTYGDAAAARLIEGPIAEVLTDMDALSTGACWQAMLRRLRNQGQPGIASLAISAVDSALWDLKGVLLNVPVVSLLGASRAGVEIYASGGFTSYSVNRLAEQVGGWAEEGFASIKMKVGSDPERDADRVAAARGAVGDDITLMVDANGAYTAKQALGLSEQFIESGVAWFEEPVSSNDLKGLRLLREEVPAPMEVTAGEYGFDSRYFRRMLEAGAVDVLQADATRCAGITGFMAVDALCQAFEIPLSAHCAPALHCHPSCAAKRIRHIEGFHDHVQIERVLFDGAPVPNGGYVEPDITRSGLGLAFRRADAADYAV